MAGCVVVNVTSTGAVLRKRRWATAGAAAAAVFFQNYGGDWGLFDQGLISADEVVRRIAARTGWPLGEVAAVVRAVPELLKKALTAAGPSSDNVTALAIMWQGSSVADSVNTVTQLDTSTVISTEALPDNLLSTTINPTSPPEQDNTPTAPLDEKLGTQGVRFNQAYANSAVCSATRIALITGRYQYRLQAGLEEPLARHGAQLGLPADHPTLPSLLKQLKLAQFRSQWQAAEQQATAEGWDPASYLYVLAEQEHQQRHQARLRRLLHEAQLPLSQDPGRVRLGCHPRPRSPSDRAAGP